MKILRKIKIRIITAAVVAALLVSHGVSATGSSSGVYSSVKNDEMKIALTFDDGPDPRYTDEILDILAEYNIKATFFVIGQNVMLYPEQIKRAVREGHEIGNHTYNHVNMKQKPYAEMCEEMSDTERLIYDTVGIVPKVMRPPGGVYSKDVVKASGSLGYSLILWTLDTLDWRHTPSDKIVGYITDNIRSGDIILMHDHVAGVSPTPDALRMVIPELLSRGYRFVTVSELIGKECGNLER